MDRAIIIISGISV